MATTRVLLCAVTAAAAMTLGLLFTVPAAQAADPDWSKAQPLDVTATDYQFSPNPVTFEHGGVYRLHLENHGKETHEFHSADFFKAATLRDPSVLGSEKDEVVLQPGDKKDVYLVAPATPATYKVYCPDHDWAGMTGEIVVK